VLGVATFASRIKKDALMADSDLKEIRRFAYRIDNIDDFETVPTETFLNCGAFLQSMSDRNDLLIQALKVYRPSNKYNYAVAISEFESILSRSGSYNRNYRKGGDYLGLQDIPDMSTIKSLTAYHKHLLRDILELSGVDPVFEPAGA